jgi:hypothetical protein
VSVTVFNDVTPPTVAITAPAAAATVGGTVTVSASATDNVGVVGVQFQLDGAALGAELTAAPYAITWDTKAAPNGAHTLTAVARDAAGNVSTAAAVSVTVFNDVTPPTVAITAPAAAATVGGTVTVSASATDNVGVVGVQFQLDGANLGAELTAAPYAVTWDTKAAPNGTHTLTAIVRDAAGNASTSAGVSVTVFNDVTPPTVAITAPAAGATVGGTVTVSASATDNVGVVGVQFQLDGAALGAELTAAPYAVTWDTKAAPNGAHTLTAVARDAAGNMGTAAAVSVTVFNDVTPPTVAITAPAAAATVGGTVTVSASATDNVGVVGVQLTLDGANLGAELTAAPYAVTWDTKAAPNGTHTLTAVARDAEGNVGTAAAVSVTVFNDVTPPTVAITAPAAGATVGGTVTVSASATDNVGVVGVQFTLDGANLGAEMTAAPYAITWDTKAAPNGTHTLTAVARDAAGNVSTSAGGSVTVFNDLTAPTVAITAPAAGATVKGTVTVSASATDNVGVVGVQFKVDGANLGLELTATPYTVAWDTTTVPSGAHTLTAVARDAAGNATTSASVTVTIDNTPPVLSGVTASGITESGATISWTTNELSDTQVEYGPTTAYGSVTALNPTLLTAHAQTLSGLAATTLYHYRVKSRDAVGNVTVSADFTFTTFQPADLVAVRAQTAITIDGVLDEWSAAREAGFSGVSNSAIGYVLWDATNLYVAFRVSDTQLSATRTARDDANLYLDDAVEIYIDTRNDRATTMQPDDYQFLVNLNNRQVDLRGTGTGKDVSWNGTWVSAVRLQGTLNSHGDSDTGYTVEIAIPWTQIGVTPVTGMVLGMDLVVDDRDPTSATTYGTFDWARIAPNPYAQPSLWKRIRLGD